MATAVKTDTFEQEVIQSETPVLVDFWAEWCGPCHAVSPVLDRIVEEQAGALKLVKVNIDEERELAERYGIASIPTMILFRDGEPSVRSSAHSRRARSSARSASPSKRFSPSLPADEPAPSRLVALFGTLQVDGVAAATSASTIVVDEVADPLERDVRHRDSARRRRRRARSGPAAARRSSPVLPQTSLTAARIRTLSSTST